MAFEEINTERMKQIMFKDYGLNCFDQEPVMPELPDESTFPPRVSLAMMYVPYQRFEKLYPDEKALERGTLFEELDMPFYGGKRGAR